uniref:Uncharacterized protein n=1 Tax=Panagrolaimus sp. JU765 TaxID=591449 RepID=A0AC34QV18_9BILA
MTDSPRTEKYLQLKKNHQIRTKSLEVYQESCHILASSMEVLEKENVDLKNRIERIQAQLLKKEELICLLEKERESLLEDRDRFQTVSNNLRRDYSALKRDCAKTQKENEELQRKYDVLDQISKDAQERNKHLSQQLEEKRKDLDELEDKCFQLEKDLEKERKESNFADLSLTRATASLEEWGIERNAYEDQCRRLTEENKALRSIIDDEKQEVTLEVEQLKLVLAEAQSDAEKYRTQFEMATQERKMLKEQHEESRKENEFYQKQIEETKLEQIRSEFETVKKSLEEMTKLQVETEERRLKMLEIFKDSRKKTITNLRPRFASLRSCDCRAGPFRSTKTAPSWRP